MNIALSFLAGIAIVQLIWLPTRIRMNKLRKRIEQIKKDSDDLMRNIVDR